MKQTTLKWVQKRRLWFTISFVVMLLGLGVAIKRIIDQKQIFNMGIDFTGGSSFLIKLDQSKLNEFDQDSQVIALLRGVLLQQGVDKATIQLTKNQVVSIKTVFFNQQERQKLLKGVDAVLGPASLLEADVIGPSIGLELRKQSIWMVLAVSALLLVYITIRFEFYFGVAALLALLHDVLVVLSIAIVTQLEVNTAFIAAVLTILGYSINDTIVVFDRVRENLPLLKEKSVLDILNLSIRQTLTRSLHTSITTMGVCLALLLFGGITIRSFASILFLGFFSGTYSSLFIACPILYQFKDSFTLDEANS